VTWRRRETPSGPHFILTSDTTLDDYRSYVEGDRLFVHIPQAALANPQGELAGHGFGEMRVEERDTDVVLSVKVLQNATVMINQKFNRVEIIFHIQRQANESSLSKRAKE
jgi:hypothetical protein